MFMASPKKMTAKGSEQSTSGKIKPVVLAILDGWGIASKSEANAVSQAKTPVLEELKKRYPNNKLWAHGR